MTKVLYRKLFPQYSDFYLHIEHTPPGRSVKGDAMTTLGREIKKARTALGWRQHQLQAATGISQKYLSRIETDHVDPSWSFVLRIARVLNLELRALYEVDPTPPTPPPPAQRPRTHKAAPVG